MAMVIPVVSTVFSGASAVCDVSHTAAAAGHIVQRSMPSTGDQLLADIRLYLDETIKILREVRPIVEEFGNTTHLTTFGECENDCDEMQTRYDAYLAEHGTGTRSWIKSFFAWKDSDTKLRAKLNRLHTEVIKLKNRSHSTSQRIQFDVHRSQSPRVQAQMAYKRSTTTAAATDSSSSTADETLNETHQQAYQPEQSEYNSAILDNIMADPLFSRNHWNQSQFSLTA
ncbi:hypothetical protein BT96DRAFT_982467 [Gymnopus androsaceus JB14]|uniref:Fungal N-terminal domain-containing protein n=1 Tax=Gymnopus androsaceus JB14 TaxID=1447944 RepID=A0A6A4GEB0_9AGAR|nr:hypothetical protein BT96DRAFT_982467 [Gymnopus androsaceus JB14]